MCKYFSVFAFCAIYVCLVKAQVVQEGTPCETPNKEYGLCVNIYSCQVVKDMLSTAGVSTEVRNFVRSLSCGYLNGTPLVCCAQQRARNTLISEGVGENVMDSGETENESGIFLLPPKCGVSNASLPRVVGGVPAKLGEFPWIVALGYKNPKNPNRPKWLCGGSLVSAKHVITAGHCVHNRPDLYLARLGELDLYDDNDGAHPVDIPIGSYKIHDSYSSTKFTSDLAILTLSRSVENLVSEGIWPICLPWQEDKKSRTYLNNQPFVAGWGALYFNGPTSSILQLATLPVVENSACQRAFGNKSVIDERIICAGYPNGEKDACQGDSGGPLMHGEVSSSEKGLRFYLIGVVSYGFRCAQAGFPGVYTRITHFLPWIQKNLI